MKYRTLIRSATRIMRHSASGLGAASVAIVFLTMGGAPAMDHSTHVGHHASSSQTSASHDSSAHAGHHAAPAQESGEDSQTTECTCVGPCQGGSPPSESWTATYAVTAGDVHQVRVAAYIVRILDHDPTSHLLPLPNPPPSRV